MSTLEIRPYVEILHGEIKTTSLKVAEHFGKRHDHVLRDIEKIIAQTADLLNAPKFGLVEYKEILEELHDNNFALQGLTNLVGIANDTIQPEGFYYLLKLVADQQDKIVGQLYNQPNHCIS